MDVALEQVDGLHISTATWPGKALDSCLDATIRDQGGYRIRAGRLVWAASVHVRAGVQPFPSL